MKRTALVVTLLAIPALGDESGVSLAAGPGADLVAAHCSMCHSLDYIQMNSPLFDRKGWEASVAKMTKVMGAPIREQDVPAIVEYLSVHYGK
jgi:mono/diheme cytochrome c family protein